MSDEIPYDIRTIDDPGMDPGTVFTKLRSFLPGRGCFLLESRAPDKPEGRYSVVGYRMVRGGMQPPGRDAIEDLTGAQAEEKRPETFAEAVANADISVLSSSVASLKQRVQLYEDEGPSAMMMSRAAVIVWDHHEKTVTVAGRVKGNQAERLIWEMGNSPDVEAPRAITKGARPESTKVMLDAAVINKRARRAKSFLGDEVDEVMLANMSHVEQDDSDPLDAYRAWFADSGAAHGYYLDFGESPAAPRIIVFGVTDEVVAVRRHGDETSLDELYHATLPLPRLTGTPPKMALKLARRLEENAHGHWGGAAGFIAPGGAGALVLCDRVVQVQDNAYWIWQGAMVTEDSDPQDTHDRIEAAAAETYSAIAAAF